MTRIQRHQHRQFSRHAVAAAVALVAAWAWPAQAQFYTYTGAINSYPTNLFPIDTSQAALNLGSNQLWVGSGDGAVGSFAALAGAQFSVGGLVAGASSTGTGNGSIVFDGAQVLVSGQGNRLDIGTWGVGSLLVKGGSLLDATFNSAACAVPGQGCGNYIGNAAGSTGSLTVTGAGSELRTLGFFGLGGGSVFTQPASAFNFGTPGGSTNASLNVLAGGTLRTQNATISMGPGGANPTGTEQTFANVLIDGAGSRWVVTPDQFNGNGAYFSTSTHANAQSTLTISNGGKLVVDASSVSNGNASIDLGSGGTSTLNLSGAGSAIEMLGANRYVNIGSRSGGSATLNLLGGATLDTRAIGLGVAGASGVLNVSGAGSWASLSGEFQNNGANLVAGSEVGGDGTITVTNGGRISISSSASTLVNGNLSMRMGSVSGATGSLTISGIGSRVELSSASTNGAFGTQDSINPYVAIGNFGGTGQLTINGGGKLIVTGGGRADWGTNIQIGGYGAGSQGLAAVVGAGSEIALTGPHARLSVGGPGGVGQLDVLFGGLVSTGNLVIADQGGTGLVHVSSSTLGIDGTDGRLRIGDTGNGTLTVDNGGLVDATLNPANCIGNWCGSIVANNAGSTGLLTISGAGSELRTLRNFDTANVHADQYNGLPGANSTATINILAGGTLRTQFTNLGGGFGGSSALGTEQSFSSVLVDGIGSKWVVTPNQIDGGVASFNASGHARAHSAITLSNGGQLVLDGASTGAGAYFTLGNVGSATLSIGSGAKLLVNGGAGPDQAHITIGQQAGSVGSATVSDVGSELLLSGMVGNLDVGGGAGSTGTLNVLNLGRVAAGGLNLGVNGGTGTLLVDNATVEVNNGFYGRLFVGANGQGSLTVRNGGLLDAAINPGACIGNWCGSGVANGAGASGLLRVEGVGSELRIVRDFFTANAWADQGFGTPGGTAAATLQIVDGGRLRTERSTLGSAAGGALSNGAELSITTVSITGPGSTWFVTPSSLDGGDAQLNLSNAARTQSFMSLAGGGQLLIDATAANSGARLYVGNGGQAQIDINSGAKLHVSGSATGGSDSHVGVGWQPGGQGTVNVSGAGSELVLSGRTANLDIGNGAGATGVMRVADGGKVTAGGMNLGAYGATGMLTVDNGRVEINQGTNGRLIVGNNSVGVLSVINGGVLDATVNPAACIGVWCGNGVGSHAGADGTMTIQGVGSEVRTLRNFFSGDDWVDQYGGVVGGTTHATINILAGGTLRTENATLGSGTGGPLANGSEKSFTSVLIDGPGSQWVVSRNTVDNGGAALMGIGGIANATANVTVSNSGLLRIDGTGGAGPNSGINIGSNGKGTLVVSGAGSKLETAGLGAFINVGASNSAGDGSFQLLAGATASSLFMNVGRNTGKGVLLIDGAGSLLTLSGVNTNAGSPGTAGASIGRNGGVGSATVSNGGQWLITDGGQDSRSVNSSPGLSVGRDIGGQGTLTITGAGSRVDIVSTSLGLAVGTPDNFNPFVAIGRDNPGTASGTLLVSDGGKLILSGNAVSTPTNGRVTGLNIGGRRGTAGNGTATVTGAGSELIVQGFDAHLGVGYSVGSTGVLNVLNQAKVSSTSMTVGADAIGTVNVDNGWIALTGHRTDSSNVGAGITVGRGANGVGTLNLANASSLKIDATVLSSGMAVGGDQFLSGGVGTVTLSGGSSILFGGPVAAGGISVGFNGSGTMSLAGASLVDVGNTRTFSMASQSSGIASLSVVGASRLLGNVINIGGNSDTAAGGVGTALVSGVGSELRASGASGFIGVGRSGIGTLTVSNQAKVAAIVLNVGRSAGGVGTLSVNNSMIALSGQQTAASLNVGAAFTVGNLGGSGTASIGNGSLVTITNLDTLGASLNVGGTPTRPFGTGTLNVSGGSQIKLVAAPGLALARIGHDGVGTANFSGGSLLDVGDGNVIIAGQPGSVGTLTLGSGSVLNAGYVGVGSLPGGIDGGTGRLFVNASTVNATTLEIGKNSLVGGHLGVINAHVINRGTFSPGNSPGHIIINGAFEIQDQGKVVLDVQDDGGGNYAVDKLVLTDATTFNFNNTQVVFNFIGNTDPTKFAATGGLDLDNFILVQDAQGHETGLSTKLASQGSSWEQAFTGGSFNATSTAYNVDLQLKLDTSGTFQVNVSAVPEPRTYALWLLGLAALSWRQRRASKGQRAAP